MPYTLGQAAKATGKAKGTILNALEKGRISGSKDDFGNWSIAPAELHRIYPPISVQQKPELNAVELALNSENSALKAALKAVQEEKDRLTEQNADLKADRDAWREQAQSLKLLTAPKEDPYAAILERLEAIEAQTKADDDTPATESAPAAKKTGFLGWFKKAG